MGKYRALFNNKQLADVKATNEETLTNDTFLEETTGDTIWAIIEANSDEEARENADRLQIELET